MTAAGIGTLVVGGLAALDGTPVAQTLASQPLVTATLLGALWGDWSTALAVGVVLQILAASTLPIGARTPEDYSVGGVVGAGVLAGMTAASLGVPLLRWQRRWNEGLARWCEGELRAGRERALAESQWAAVLLAFAIGLAVTALWLSLAHAGARIVYRESLRLAGAWHLLQPLWLGFGFAQLLHAFVQRRLERAGVFAAALVGAWLVIVAGAP